MGRWAVRNRATAKAASGREKYGAHRLTSSLLMNSYPAFAKPVLIIRSAVVVKIVALTLQPNLFHVLKPIIGLLATPLVAAAGSGSSMAAPARVAAAASVLRDIPRSRGMMKQFTLRMGREAMTVGGDRIALLLPGGGVFNVFRGFGQGGARAPRSSQD